jgi:hypothetical protein
MPRLGGLFFQVVQHGLSVRDLKRVGRAVVHEAWFYKELFDNAVVDKHAVAPGAVSEAKVVLFDEHAHLFRKVAVTVREHEDFLELQILGPLEHDKGIIDGETDDFINAKFF